MHVLRNANRDVVIMHSVLSPDREKYTSLNIISTHTAHRLRGKFQIYFAEGRLLLIAAPSVSFRNYLENI